MTGVRPHARAARCRLAGAVLLAAAVASQAAPPPSPPRGVQPAGQTLPLRPARRIAFETDEGTWMSLDAAPDGRSLVFDLLGDLYTLDARGGRARPLLRGMAVETQPAYSPDGRWIAFVGDRSGAENLWRVRPDGSGLEQLSFGDDDTVLVSPAWSADGRALYVSRFRWSVNDYELWRYDLDGGQTLLSPARTEGGARRSALGAAPSADGRWLYYARRDGGQDGAKLDTWSIVRRDLASGEETVVVPEPGVPGRRPFAGTFFRPLPSRDGRWLAYGARWEGRTGLRLRDLRSGADRWLAFPVEQDQSMAQSWQDLLPRFAFSADGRALLLAREGRFERIPLDGGAPAPVPFVAEVELALGPLTRVDVREETGPVRARLIRTPRQSPDGRRLAFSALGRLYLMPLNGAGAARPLLPEDAPPAFHPAWSPDGRLLAYVTWDGARGGRVWVAPADGGAPRALTAQADYYTQPVFAPDGRTVYALRSDNRARMQASMVFGSVRESELLALPVGGGPARVVRAGDFGGTLHLDAAGTKVHVRDGDGGTVAISLVDGAASAPAKITGPGWYFQDGPVPVDDVRISPDGRWALAQVAQQLHLLPAPAPGATVDLSAPGVEHRRITDVGADDFDWADGGRTIAWSVGARFHRRALAGVALNPPDRPGWSADAPRIGTDTEAFDAVVEVPRDVPEGTLLLRGATAITMRGEEAIEDADVLVRDGRILAIGPRGTVDVPAGVQARDVSGRFLVPGFIDIHDHVADIRRDLLDTDAWGLRARLAYGITTAFDPSSLSIDMLAYQDLVDAGRVLGARVPSTGMAMFSFNRIASPEEARALLARYRDRYRLRNVKQYLIGNRRQRQWLVQAASEMGVMPTTEGSLSFRLGLSQVVDGYAGHEHSLGTPLYRDAIELLARSGTSYDTTLQIVNGGPPAQDRYVARDAPLGDPLFRATRPYEVAMQSVQARQWVDPALMLYPRLAADAARLQRAGGVVGMGSHGEIPGPGFHWELEAHVEGGMTPHEALRAATLGSATAIGRAAEFGSLEPGKFADLLVLEADPRGDIRNTRRIAEVMKHGRLYRAGSLDELWPRQRPAPAPGFSGQAPAPR
nr:amidohydrolase family protein [Luteimonas sp. Y-2-2-4F]